MSNEDQVHPFSINPNIQISASQQIQAEMEYRRKNWMKEYKSKLDLNDVLEVRNP